MTNILRQGAVDFSVGYKVQTTWGSQETLTFSFEGLGASLFCISLLALNQVGMIAGTAILALSGVLLMMHLGRPRNMIYVMANFRHSWMSRGAVFIPVFIALAIVLVVATTVFDWTPNLATRSIIFTVVLALTLFTVTKSGLVLSTFPAIPFWSGGLMPVIFALSGLSSGLAVFSAFDHSIEGPWLWLMPGLTAALLIALGSHLMAMRSAGRASKVSADLINQQHATTFYGLGLGIGVILPLALAVYGAVAGGDVSLAVLVAIAVSRFVGDIVIRDVILKVGVYDKVR